MMLVAMALGLAGIFGWYAAYGRARLDKLAGLLVGRPDVRGSTAEVRHSKSPDGLEARHQAQVKAQAEEQAQEEAHAKFLRCQQQAGEPPRNNETLRQLGLGLNQITIANGGDDDAVASFRSVGGTIAMSVFVAANSTATIFDFPDGRYRLEFAFGREWSRPCHFFLRGNQTQMLPKYESFTASSGSFYQTKYTIPPVPGGNIAAVPLDAEEFKSWDK